MSTIDSHDPPAERFRGRQRLWIALAMSLVLCIPAMVWAQGDIVDQSACDRGGAFADSRTPIGPASWVSVALPVAKVDGVRIASYRVVGSGLEDADVMVKIADRQRYLNGRSSGLSFSSASYGEKLEGYLPGITQVLADPRGVRIRVLSNRFDGRHPNLALFVGAARKSTTPLTVDAVEVTFRSGLRSQTCAIGVHFSMGPDAEEFGS